MSGLFGDAEFRRELKKLMLPIAFQTLMLNAAGFGDTLMLGFIDQSSMAAVSLATQVYFVMTLFIGTLTGGATVLSAQYAGKGDLCTVKSVFSIITRYSLIISAVFFCATAFAPEAMMRAFTGDAAMTAIGADYLRMSSAAFLLGGVSQCYLCMLKVNGRAREGSIITTCATLLDLALNAVFIFGLLGAPAMGARGAALTTAITRGVELIAVVAYTHATGALTPGARGMARINAPLEREFWKYSFPVFLNEMAWGGGVTVYSMIIGHLGADATAGNSIANVIKNLIICLSTGLGSASGIMLGRILGKNRLDAARDYGRRLSRLSIACGFITAALALALGPAIARIFDTNAATRGYLDWMIACCAANCVARCVNDTVICGVFAAGGDTRFDAQSLIVTMWGVIIPLALCAAFWWRLPVTWVYLILSMDEIIKLPWVYARYRRYLWLRNITRDDISNA